MLKFHTPTVSKNQTYACFILNNLVYICKGN